MAGTVSTKGLWHINDDGNPGKCNAEIKPCPFKEHYATEQEAIEVAEQRNSEHLGSTTGMKRGDATDTTERITTLLTNRIPLNDERTGSVPKLKDTDDAISVINKLGAYINKNFNGDDISAAASAIESLYGSSTHEWTGDDDNLVNTIERYRDYLERKTGAPVIVLEDDAGVLSFISNGKITKSVLNTGVSFRGTRRQLRTLNFGMVMAGKAIYDEMDKTNISGRTLTTVANGLMSRERGSVGFHLAESETPKINGLGIDNLKTLIGEDSVKDWNNKGEILDAIKGKLNDENVQNDYKLRYQLASYRDLVRDEYEDVHHRYYDAVTNILDDERNGELNREYAKRANSAHSATVYEDKKNRDESHVLAGENSTFADDFNNIEIDDSVDLDKFNKIQNEWKTFRTWLPETNDKATFRFRKTGRHHALGVYAPAKKNIAVDPRSPSALGHEYIHHWDYNSRTDGMQQSMSPDFRPIVKSYQQNLDKTAIRGSDDKYTAPTEVLARAGELYLHWKHADDSSSFLATDSEYEHQFDYQPLLPFKNDIIAFFDKRMNH